MISSTSCVLSFLYNMYYSNDRCPASIFQISLHFPHDFHFFVCFALWFVVLTVLNLQAMNIVLISYHHFFYSSLKLVRIFKALGNLFYFISCLIILFLSTVFNIFRDISLLQQFFSTGHKIWVFFLCVLFGLWTPLEPDPSRSPSCDPVVEAPPLRHERKHPWSLVILSSPST